MEPRVQREGGRGVDLGERREGKLTWRWSQGHEGRGCVEMGWRVATDVGEETRRVMVRCVQSG